MQNIEQRYEKRGKLRPCSLDQDDLVTLSHIVQETFSRPEIDRYFRVSTTLGNTRVFFRSMGDLLVQKDLPDKVSDLSFWIEGWGHQSRFDRNVLLDFSQYSVQLQVEGIDPVWVYDKYNSITKFLKGKTAWYWPVIWLEKFLVFSMTLILIISAVLSFRFNYPLQYFGKVALLGFWVFLLFFDTRRIWPYSYLRLKGSGSLFSKENVCTVGILIVMIAVIMEGVIISLFH